MVEQRNSQLFPTTASVRRAAIHFMTSAPVRSAVKVGHPFLEIVRYSKDEDVDLIVMRTHERGLLSHILMGNVAENVVRQAPCPVLVVWPPHHEFAKP